jgi:hypothetical protein
MYCCAILLLLFLLFQWNFVFYPQLAYFAIIGLLIFIVSFVTSTLETFFAEMLSIKLKLWLTRVHCTAYYG